MSYGLEQKILRISMYVEVGKSAYVFNMKEKSFMPSLKFKKIRAIMKIKTEVLARSMAI